MFNPKKNLLDQQLAVSGLEMGIEAITASLIGAGISAGTSILGGIFGSSQASKQNAAARRAERKQTKAAKKVAKAANKYNAEAFRIERENYYNNRNFQYETALKDYRYQQQIRDFEYRQVLKQYSKSVENTESQLTFNSIAAIDAYESEQRALNEIRREDAFNRQGSLVISAELRRELCRYRREDAFNRQGSLVDRLQEEGTAALGQAGNSRNKGIQSRVAAAGRNETISDASLASSVEQSQRNMTAIALQKYAADMQAKASMMIKPEPLPTLPIPELGPEMIFMPPMEATPAYIPPARQVSTVAPLISGVSSAASTLADVSWGDVFGGGGGEQQSAAVKAGWPGNRNY